MRNDGDLRCQEFVELVTDYLEEQLPATARARFEAHLELCDGCARYLEQMRQTIRATGVLDRELIPCEAMDELLQVFRGWKTEA